MKSAFPHNSSPLRLQVGVCLLLAFAAAASGCNFVRAFAWVIGGDPETKVNVKAQYHGLEGKTFAVLVSADPNTLYAYPDAVTGVCRAVTARLAGGIKGAKAVNPDEVVKFQRENSDWNTIPYADLIRRLKVERLVVVDLAQYSLSESGDQFVWHGRIVAAVGVVEAEAANPSNFVVSIPVRAAYPEGATVGVVNTDDNAIRLGLLDNFSFMVYCAFHDHTEIQQ